MRVITLMLLVALACTVSAAELESRILTHYVPQDQLDSAVRIEGWSEITLNVKGGVRKGDIVRIWAGGLIDRGGADQPGDNVNGPSGLADAGVLKDKKQLALSQDESHAFVLLFK